MYKQIEDRKMHIEELHINGIFFKYAIEVILSMAQKVISNKYRKSLSRISDFSSDISYQKQKLSFSPTRLQEWHPACAVYVQSEEAFVSMCYLWSRRL